MADLCQDPFQLVTMIVRSTIDLAHNFGMHVVAEEIGNEQAATAWSGNQVTISVNTLLFNSLSQRRYFVQP